MRGICEYRRLHTGVAYSRGAANLGSGAGGPCDHRAIDPLSLGHRICKGLVHLNASPKSGS